MNEKKNKKKQITQFQAMKIQGRRKTGWTHGTQREKEKRNPLIQTR